MSDRLITVQRALIDAPAEAVVERLGEALGKEYGLDDTDLLLVDYRLAALLPLLTGSGAATPLPLFSFSRTIWSRPTRCA